MRPRLTSHERRCLAIVYPAGTLATGSSIGLRLYQRGFLEVGRFGRYSLTAEGAAAIEHYPESKWKLPQQQQAARREWRR